MANRTRRVPPTEASPRTGGAPSEGGELVEITWREDLDPRRLRRVADILADILDNAGAPGDRERQ